VFTGIIEQACPLVATSPDAGRVRLTLDLSPLLGAEGGAEAAPLVGLGDSVALNGCCLTVAALDGALASFDVIPESLALTNLGDRTPGDRLNVERALRYGQRVDGHLVQGHVETTGRVLAAEQGAGELRLTVGCDPAFSLRCLPKGSITLDGVSLTIAELGDDRLTVALVPHTLERTNLGDRQVGDAMNLEPDMVGQWVLRLLQGSGQLPPR